MDDGGTGGRGTHVKTQIGDRGVETERVAQRDGTGESDAVVGQIERCPLLNWTQRQKTQRV